MLNPGNLPTLTYKETVPEHNDTEHVINLLDEVSGCEDAFEADVNESTTGKVCRHGDKDIVIVV